MRIWHDGQWQTANEGSKLFGTMAFQYGFGLFETIRVRTGTPADLEEHVQRLLRSIAQLDSGTPCYFDLQQMEDAVFSYLEKSAKGDGILKIVAYRGDDRWHLLLMSRPYPYDKKIYERGFALKRSACLRNPKSLLVYHKTLNYLENHLERQKARHQGYDDAYFLNTSGIVTECTAANFFIVRSGELITSPVQEGMLPGIMRAKLLAKAKDLGLRVWESPIREEMLPGAEMVLVTNALYGAMPVSRIEAMQFHIDRTFIDRINQVLDRG